MTAPDLPSIDEPMADLAHERLRLTTVAGLEQVTADMDALRAQLADLTDRIAALETPPAP